MNKKKFLALTLSWLLLGCSAAFVSACGKGQSTENSSYSSSSSLDESVTEETPGLTVEREDIELGVGDNYTLTATAQGTDSPVYSFAIDGDSSDSVIMLTAAKTGSAVVTGLSVGTAKIVVSTVIDGETYWKTVTVTVNQAAHLSVSIVNLSPAEGCYTLALSTVENPSNEEDKTFVVPQTVVYNRGEVLTGAEIAWTSANSDVVAVEQGGFKAVSEGETELYGVFERAGEQVNVLVKVSVYRPTILLEGKATVEVENLSAIHVSEALEGEVKEVTLHGEAVGDYTKITRTVNLDKTKLPVSASLMGEDKEFVLETDKAYYIKQADIYTMIIDSKEELDSMGTIAKACNPSGLLWDGYFVLGADIEYNGRFKSVGYSSSIYNCPERVQDWTNGLVHGFQGVFDGKGYNVDGLSIDEGTECGGLFGVLNAKGIVKNVSFTNASVAANSGLICVAGAGTIENVYIQYASIGAGSLHPSQIRYSGSFFLQGVDVGASVTSCIIDISKTKFSNVQYVRAMGDSNVEYQRVFVIGGDETIRTASGVSATYENLREFLNDKSVQMIIQKLDADFWTVDGGVALPTKLHEDLAAIPVEFFANAATKVVAGTAYNLTANTDYVQYNAEGEGVRVVDNLLAIDGTVANGTKVKVKAVSLFDESNFAETEFTVLSVNNVVDFTQEDKLAYVDLTTKEVNLSDFNGSIPTDKVLYYADESGNGVNVSELTGTGVLTAVTEEGLFTFNYRAVTKIIHTLDDLRMLTYKNVNIEGEYILGGDIDAAGGVISGASTYYNGTVGFMGVLDGRGYTISNLVISGYGIFGALANATIKNINFKDVTAGACLFAYNTFDTRVENVNITIKDVAGTYGLLTASYASGSTFRNVTVDATAVTAEVKTLLGVAYRQLTSAMYPVFENVVVKAPTLKAFATGDWDKDPTEVEWPEGITRIS